MKNISLNILHEKAFNYLKDNYDYINKIIKKSRFNYKYIIKKDDTILLTLTCKGGLNGSLKSVYLDCANIDFKYFLKYKDISLIVFEDIGPFGEECEITI